MAFKELEKDSGITYDETTGRFRTEYCEIWLDEEGILYLKSLEAGFIMDYEETLRCFDTYRMMGLENKPVLQIMDFRNPLSMSNEGKAYAARVGSQFFIASAVVSDSLSVRILFNFFNRFYKHDVPFRMFGNEEAAKTWLKTFVE